MGVYSLETGEFGESVLYFKKALSYGDKRGYVNYNISRVYSDIGETQAAVRILADKMNSTDEKITYRNNYLRGVIAYNSGQYHEAALFFKKSVQIDNSDIKLLKNLELSIFQMENKKKDEGGKTDKKSSYLPEQSGVEILDYIFSEEVPVWIESPEDASESTPDW